MRRAFLLMFALGAPLGPLCAQSHSVRRQIAEFRDSILDIAAPDAMASVITAERARRRPGDRSVDRMRLGWALLRLGQLTDSGKPMIDATTEFWEAAVRHRDWPIAWFGLGAAKVALDAIGAREFRSAHQTAGNGWRQGAVIAFLEAVRAEPGFREAAIEMAKVTLRDDRIVLLNGVGEAIRRTVAQDSLDPLAWFLLARFERRTGNDSAAAQAYGRALDLGGPERGVASLELARQLFWLGRPDSASRWYFSGAGFSDPSGISAYRADIATIASEEALAIWDSLPPEARPDWLHTFWRTREIASGRPKETRLPEHERRWQAAYQHYRLIPAWTYQYDFGMPYRSGSDELDDRGIIFIRHGTPDQLIVHFSSMGEEPGETWFYVRPDGNLIFHFKPAGGGWRAVESITEIGNPRVLDDVLELDPIYLSMAAARHGRSRGGAIPDRLVARERKLVRTALIRGTTTDTDPLRFERPLHPIVQIYGIPDASRAGGSLLVVLALPAGDSLEAKPLADGGVGYLIRLRLTVPDLALEVDTVFRMRAPRPIAGDQLLATLLRLDVPAGEHEVRAIVSDSVGDRGAARLVTGIPIPAFGGPLEMSDLVLGLDGEALAWDRGATRFPLNPRNAWTPQEAVEIGFDLDGLVAGRPYRVRIGIADLGADTTQPPRTSIEFEYRAGDSREQVTQSLSLRSLRPGRYLLIATVTVGDQILRRERRITVAAP